MPLSIKMKVARPIIIVLFLGLAVLLIFSFNLVSANCERYQYYSGILGSLLAAVFAAFLVWVAWEQLATSGKPRPQISCTRSTTIFSRVVVENF